MNQKKLRKSDEVYVMNQKKLRKSKKILIFKSLARSNFLMPRVHVRVLISHVNPRCFQLYLWYFRLHMNPALLYLDQEKIGRKDKNLNFLQSPAWPKFFIPQVYARVPAPKVNTGYFPTYLWYLRPHRNPALLYLD